MEKYAIKDKVVLKEKTDKANIPVTNLLVTLSWQAAVDLDLYCMYRSFDGVESTIYFHNKGSLNTAPFIKLDRDDGVGDVGGRNEENIRIENLWDTSHLLLVANIFNKPNANFALFDGKVSVSSLAGHGFEVPLTASEGGSWCVIARVDNAQSVNPFLINVNEVTFNKPKISDYVGPIPEVQKPKGFFSKIKNIFA